jgi:DAACS family dicarboxylate/amino acid:cation (Na+ or H+) symporter
MDQLSHGSRGTGAGLASNLGVQLVAAIALGVVLGRLLGERAAVLGELGALVVRLLKAMATPLVFCAVVDAVARAPISGRMGLRLLAICLTNTAVAALLAIGLALTIAPGKHADPALAARLLHPSGAAQHAETSLHDALETLVPESLLRPFVDNRVLTVVLFALAVGLGLRRLGVGGGAPGARLAALARDGLHLLQVILHAIVRVVPLAILGVVARVVGESGFALFGALSALVGAVTLGLVLHVAGYYSLLVRLAGRSPRAFWRASVRPLLTALSTGSSMATLPVTLETLDGELAVGPAASRLAACVGTNFNNDGIMLYEVVAAIFVAQLTGHALSPGALAMLCATSAFAAAGIAGVPEAGLITLALVLQAARLPTELLPVLLSVDWLLGRLRAATNVASDLVVSTLLDTPRTGGSPTAP